MKKFATMAVAVLVPAFAVVGLSRGETKDDAVIKNVMKAAMKGGLCKKVADGKANDTQKKELLALFEKLADATPPKGDLADWKAKTTPLVKAAQAAVDDTAGAGDQLKKAANCKACHEAHKGK